MNMSLRNQIIGLSVALLLALSFNIIPKLSLCKAVGINVPSNEQMFDTTALAGWVQSNPMGFMLEAAACANFINQLTGGIVIVIVLAYFFIKK